MAQCVHVCAQYLATRVFEEIPLLHHSRVVHHDVHASVHTHVFLKRGCTNTNTYKLIMPRHASLHLATSQYTRHL